MAREIEITDQKSARAWLGTQDHQTQVWFAVRCALRGLPELGNWEDATKSGVAFTSLRATVISAAAAVCPAAEMKLIEPAAAAAVRAATAATTHVAAAPAANINAATFVFNTAATDFSTDIAAAPVRAVSTAIAAAAAAATNGNTTAATNTIFAIAAAAAFSAASHDANQPTQWGALWPNTDQPGGFHQGWEALRAQWADDPEDWAFWIEWYEGILNGKPLPWELTQRIALEVTEAEWDAGPKVVAPKIRRIQAECNISKAPLAETLEINPETGLFRAIPIQIENTPLISALLSCVEDALEDALQGNNDLNDRSSEVKKLNRTFSRYSNDPQRIEIDFTSVAIGLRRQLHETEELSKSEDNLALLEAIEEGVRGLRATHPEVASNRTLLARQAWRELSGENKELLADVQPVLIAISEDIVAEDFAQDIPTLINDALLPLPNGAPPLQIPDATLRIFNRVSKMSLLYQAATENGAKIFDSPEFKTVRLGLTVSAIFSLLVGMAYTLLGVL